MGVFLQTCLYDHSGYQLVFHENMYCALKDTVFYMHAPNGIGRSKLAASSEKLLGAPMTDRNWRTVCKVNEMVKELE
jgi:uncharacterized protein (DUF1697 family)